MSTRGADLGDVGFMHGSDADQVAAVAELVYADDPEPLVVLVISEDLVKASGTEVRVEDGGNGEFYPHIYGPLVPEQVIRVEPAGFENGRFWWGPSVRDPDLNDAYAVAWQEWEESGDAGTWAVTVDDGLT